METLLADIEAFCAAHGLSEWQFGELALSDRHFIRQLRGEDGKEREPRRKTRERVTQFMREYREQKAVEAQAPAKAA